MLTVREMLSSTPASCSRNSGSAVLGNELAGAHGVAAEDDHGGGDGLAALTTLLEYAMASRKMKQESQPSKYDWVAARDACLAYGR
jgi:hypothetical protein